MKIYTRTGDDGSTSLLAGERVSKAHLRIAACGTLDELNCAIGVARAAGPTLSTDEALATIQRHLFELGADFAEAVRKSPARTDPVATTWMESEIDRMTTELPPLKNFVLPGGSAAASQIHFARAVCRRAEREVVCLSQSEQTDKTGLIFLNRLRTFFSYSHAMRISAAVFHKRNGSRSIENANGPARAFSANGPSWP